MDPGAATEVALTATQTGSGSWVRYLLTVRNTSESEFTGNVLLIDHDRPEDGGGAAAPQLPSTTRPPTLPAAGDQVAPESAYKVRVTVAPLKERTITVVAPDSFNTAVVEDLAGNQVIAQVDVDRGTVVPVAVLSDVETAARMIAGISFDRYSPRVASFSQARTFPASPLLLGSFAAVVVDQFDTAALSGRQVQALRDYAGLGGSLVLVGGAGWRRTLAPLPGDLLPLRPAATATTSLGPVSSLAGIKPLEGSVAAATGALAAGARVVLAGADGAPLMVEASYGAGRIVELAFDPGDALQPGLATTAWTQVIGRSFSELPGGEPSVSLLPGPETNFSTYFAPPGEAPIPSPWLVGPLLLGYVLLVVPVNYWLLRRRRRPALMWFTAPLLAGLFTGVFYLAGQAVQGTLQDHSVQVLRLAPNGLAAQVQYDRILFLRRGNHLIQPAAGSLVAPLTLNTYRTTGSTCERCTVQLSGLPAGSEHVLPGPQPVVEEQGVVYGSVRVVAATSTVRPDVQLATHLKISGGRLVGTITNQGGRQVRWLTLFSFDGQAFHSAFLAAILQPGATFQVDSAIEQLAAQPSPGGQGQGQEGTNLARTLATVALQRDTQPLLVGFTDPLASSVAVDGDRPGASTVTAFELPVALDSADALVADFSRKRLASASGSQRDGFVDVYDFQLPPVAGDLHASWDRRWVQQAEVYDWSTGAWRPVAAPRDDANPTVTTNLAAGETQGGVVRLRIREPRLSWGSTLAVEITKPSG